VDRPSGELLCQVSISVYYRYQPQIHMNIVQHIVPISSLSRGHTDTSCTYGSETIQATKKPPWPRRRVGSSAGWKRTRVRMEKLSDSEVTLRNLGMHSYYTSGQHCTGDHRFTSPAGVTHAYLSLKGYRMRPWTTRLSEMARSACASYHRY